MVSPIPRPSAPLLALALAAVITAACGSVHVGDGALLDCESIEPMALPSGAEPGPVTEGVGGGAKSLTWGEGRDRVELRLGLSYYAEAADPVIARIEVRGEPAIVYEIGQGEPAVMVDWGDACQYSMTLSPELTDEEVVRYAERF